MKFENSNSSKKIGMVIGYLFSYMLFTAILYGILFFLKKLPTSWSYMHVIAITALVAVTGVLIRRILR